MNDPSVFIGRSSSIQLGDLWAAVSEVGLWAFSFGISEETFIAEVESRGKAHIIKDWQRCAQVLDKVIEYLQGQRTYFCTPVDWWGMTSFQIAVQKAVMEIPYGQTSTYGKIAALVGKPKAARAVGQVNASNPISIIIPCHRLVGADGDLRGYGGAGGLETKRWLLELESSHKK